jgi:hypothetical protein
MLNNNSISSSEQYKPRWLVRLSMEQSCMDESQTDTDSDSDSHFDTAVDTSISGSGEQKESKSERVAKKESVLIDFGTEKNYGIYDGDSFDNLIEPVNAILPGDWYIDPNHMVAGFEVMDIIGDAACEETVDLVARIQPMSLFPDSDEDEDEEDADEDEDDSTGDGVCRQGKKIDFTMHIGAQKIDVTTKSTCLMPKFRYGDGETLQCLPTEEALSDVLGQYYDQLLASRSVCGHLLCRCDIDEFFLIPIRTPTGTNADIGNAATGERQYKVYALTPVHTPPICIVKDANQKKNHARMIQWLQYFVFKPYHKRVGQSLLDRIPNFSQMDWTPWRELYEKNWLSDAQKHRLKIMLDWADQHATTVQQSNNDDNGLVTTATKHARQTDTPCEPAAKKQRQ